LSYEVFIDVEHHPKHADDAAQKLGWCVKWADLPEGTDPLVYVVNALRDMADEIDPRVRCKNCGEIRGDHFSEGDAAGLHHCHGRHGPVTQSSWWEDARA
jgi:hypothetical protein